MAGNEVSLVREFSSDSPLRKETQSPVVLLDGPVFLKVKSSINKVSIDVQDTWERFAIELGNSSQSSLGLLVQISVGSWEVKNKVWIESVTLDGLKWLEIVQSFKDLLTLVPKSK